MWTGSHSFSVCNPRWLPSAFRWSANPVPWPVGSHTTDAEPTPVLWHWPSPPPGSSSLTGILPAPKPDKPFLFLDVCSCLSLKYETLRLLVLWVSGAPSSHPVFRQSFCKRRRSNALPHPSQSLTAYLSGLQSGVPQPTASGAAGHLLEAQVLGPCSRPPEWETLGAGGVVICVLTSPPGDYEAH